VCETAQRSPKVRQVEETAFACLAFTLLLNDTLHGLLGGQKIATKGCAVDLDRRDQFAPAYRDLELIRQTGNGALCASFSNKEHATEFARCPIAGSGGPAIATRLRHSHSVASRAQGRQL
jgi:hypothetical protein